MLAATINGTDYRVRFYHQVPFVTNCLIHVGKEDEEKVVGQGVAYCNPVDNFSRKAGRKLSLSRAMKSAGFDKSTRSQVWNDYFKKSPEK